MDEAVLIALKDVRRELQTQREDFQAHVQEDRRDIGFLRDQIKEWNGQLKIICWLSSVILAVVLAYGAKHW